MTMQIFASRFEIARAATVEPQDILDAIATCSPVGKLEVDIPPPGKGPDFFLNWARQELDEAPLLDNQDARYRKYYNASVYSKAAIECLVDWYLSKHVLHHTISPHSGIAKKLESLDSQNLLGISFSLFNDVVFEPRNRGIHKFELVEETEARHGYELAHLTLKNCVHTVSPGAGPVYYGELEAYEGAQALDWIGQVPSAAAKAFFFAGIGEAGSVSVLIDRETERGNISVLTSLGEGRAESRSCAVRGRFTPEQLRFMFEHLEGAKPKALHVDRRDLRYVLDQLLGHLRRDPNGKGTRRKRPQ